MGKTVRRDHSSREYVKVYKKILKAKLEKLENEEYKDDFELFEFGDSEEDLTGSD